MRVGDVLQVKDGGLKGVRVVLLRQSDRTGRWSVRLLDNRGIWKEGDTTLFDPSELEAYSPQDAVINRAAGLADLPMDHLRLLATSGANAHQALQELQGCTRGDLIRKILKGEFIGS